MAFLRNEFNFPAIDLYIERNDGPPEGRPTYSPGPTAWQRYEGWWRLLWHRLVPQSGELSAEEYQHRSRVLREGQS